MPEDRVLGNELRSGPQEVAGNPRRQVCPGTHWPEHALDRSTEDDEQDSDRVVVHGEPKRLLVTSEPSPMGTGSSQPVKTAVTRTLESLSLAQAVSCNALIGRVDG